MQVQVTSEELAFQKACDVYEMEVFMDEIASLLPRNCKIGNCCTLNKNYDGRGRCTARKCAHKCSLDAMLYDGYSCTTGQVSSIEKPMAQKCDCKENKRFIQYCRICTKVMYSWKDF